MVYKQQTAWPGRREAKQDLPGDSTQPGPADQRSPAGVLHQDSGTLGLVGNPTHCELTWEYTICGPTSMSSIWVSAPGVDWERFSADGRSWAQYATWRKPQHALADRRSGNRSGGGDRASGATASGYDPVSACGRAVTDRGRQ